MNEYKNFNEFSQSKEYLIWVLSNQLFIERLEIFFTDGSSWKSADDEITYLFKGKYHRSDGPAIEYVNGGKEWWVNGKYHRSDGPAIDRANGVKIWFLNGKLHRIDGPAIEYASGDKAWYMNGVPFTEKQFNKRIQKL